MIARTRLLFRRRHMARFSQDEETGPVWYARDHQNVPPLEI